MLHNVQTMINWQFSLSTFLKSLPYKILNDLENPSSNSSRHSGLESLCSMSLAKFPLIFKFNNTKYLKIHNSQPQIFKCEALQKLKSLNHYRRLSSDLNINNHSSDNRYSFHMGTFIKRKEEASL